MTVTLATLSLGSQLVDAGVDAVDVVLLGGDLCLAGDDGTLLGQTVGPGYVRQRLPGKAAGVRLIG
jgi:hypothetical protein